MLPIYWLREGGRRAGAEVGFSQRAADAGERLAEELECVVCHGADLGGANYAPVVLDIGNQFSDQDSYIVKTTWRAPALDDVFTRFDTDAENLDEVDEVRANSQLRPRSDASLGTSRRWSPDLPRS